VKRSVIFNLFKYTLAFGLLTWVIWMNWEPGSPTGLQHVWNKHVVEGQPIGLGYLALAAGFMIFALSLTVVRWYILVRAQGLPFTLPDAFRLGWIGFFFNTFLPGSIGGDIVKAAGLARSQSRRTVAVATVIMDRAIALWALVWFVAIAGSIFKVTGLLEGPAAGTSKTIVNMAVVLVLLSVGVWVAMGFLPQARAEKFASRLSKIPKVGHSAAEFWRAVWMYRCQQKCIARALLISWIGQVGFVMAFYFSMRTLWEPGMGLVPTVAQHFLLVPIGLVIQAAPLFPGGAGIGELGFGGLYSWFGCASAVAVLGSLMQRVINWVIGLGGYLVCMGLKARPVTNGETLSEGPKLQPHAQPQLATETT